MHFCIVTTCDAAKKAEGSFSEDNLHVYMCTSYARAEPGLVAKSSSSMALSYLLLDIVVLLMATPPVAPFKKIMTYDKDIWSLPQSFDGSIPIPRSVKKHSFRCANGLIGKIRLTSEMSEEEIMSEIRSVFEKPF